MIITSKTKPKWVEVTVEDSNTIIKHLVWKEDLKGFKAQLENVIGDIDFMIEKLDEGGQDET